MCGIAGIVARAGGRADATEAAVLSAALEHRGPDDDGVAGWSAESGLELARNPAELSPAVAILVHRRLAIIDIGPGGRQPKATTDGRFTLTFNGEIYNYAELRRELESEGAVFLTSSDTEVLLQALACWGIRKTLPRLVGMFAFALLDSVSGNLTLARDPFGIKPLFWCSRQGDLLFASEINALLRLPGIGRAVRPQALFDYLRYGVTDRGDGTLLASIGQIPPGHFAVVDLSAPSAPRAESYWCAAPGTELDISFDEAAAEMRRLFLDSVGLHLRADVAVGAALSGGIDSSAVVGAMRQLGGDSLDLHTFSFISPGHPLNEEHWIDIAGTGVGAKMHLTSGMGGDFAGDLDRLIERQGEPFGSVSVCAQDRVYRLAREQGIKVTLDGQGADEMLAGYTQFRGARLAGLVTGGHLAQAARFVLSLGPRAATFGTLARAADHLLPAWGRRAARAAAGEGLIPDWADRRWMNAHDIDAEHGLPRGRGGFLRAELAASLDGGTLPALLRYQDRNSMTHSVESRVPFLTTAIADFALALPEKHLISDRGQTKCVFRAAMRGIVDDRILNRPEKIGFTVPQESTMAGADGWLSRLLGGDTLQGVPAIDRRAVAGTLRARASGRRGTPPHVWRWANLARWAEIVSAEFA